MKCVGGRLQFDLLGQSEKLTRFQFSKTLIGVLVLCSVTLLVFVHCVLLTYAIGA